MVWEDRKREGGRGGRKGGEEEERRRKRGTKLEGKGKRGTYRRG